MGTETMLASPMSRIKPSSQLDYHPQPHTISPPTPSLSQAYPQLQNGMANLANSNPSSAITSPNKRPKLSLQTSMLPITYGKSSTGLTSANTANTGTPTLLNTFSNAYPTSIPLRPSPNTASPVGYSHRFPKTGARAAAKPSRSTVHRTSHPYVLNLPLGLKSILRNSPIPPTLRRTTNSASPATTRRVFFPPTKKVSFRSGDDLEETITNKEFIAAHADLSSSEDEEEKSVECSKVRFPRRVMTGHAAAADRERDEDGSDGEEKEDLHDLSTTRKRKGRTSRKIQAIEFRERLTKTEIHERKFSSRRKRRRWEWTLGAVGGPQIQESKQLLAGQEREESTAETAVSVELLDEALGNVSPSRIALPASP